MSWGTDTVGIPNYSSTPCCRVKIAILLQICHLMAQYVVPPRPYIQVLWGTPLWKCTSWGIRGKTWHLWLKWYQICIVYLYLLLLHIKYTVLNKIKSPFYVALFWEPWLFYISINEAMWGLFFLVSFWGTLEFLIAFYLKILATFTVQVK